MFGDLLEDFDVNALIDGYTQIEVAKANASSTKYQNQTEVQKQTLDPPEYDSDSEAVAAGNAPNPATTNAMTTSSIPPAVKYAAGGVLGTMALVLMVKAVS